MSKCVLTLGNTPAECLLEIDGQPMKNVTSVVASVDMENGAALTYRVTTEIDDCITEEVYDVDFNIVKENS